MTPHVNITRPALVLPMVALFIVISSSFSEDVQSQIGRFAARDPGVRSGSAGAGGMIQGLAPLEQQLFGSAREAFEELQSVQGSIPDTEAGLGPRFNLDSCAGCHAQPDVGGTSPFLNPQVEVAKKRRRE
jgi:hypothetical protein